MDGWDRALHYKLCRRQTISKFANLLLAAQIVFKLLDFSINCSTHSPSAYRCVCQSSICGIWRYWGVPVGSNFQIHIVSYPPGPWNFSFRKTALHSIQLPLLPPCPLPSMHYQCLVHPFVPPGISKRRISINKLPVRGFHIRLAVE